jgi:N-acetylglucosaminyldiphosphoundecaprenol N-acetyl-beta-D-mannosaminyltransferase
LIDQEVLKMADVLGIKVSETSYSSSSQQILTWAQSAENRYICVANVHVLMEAYDSAQYHQILNHADMVTPDGMPLVWMLRLKGVKGQTRVYGPTLMLHVLELAAREGIPVGFYGAEARILELLVKRLRERFPGLTVAYAFSPPFRALNESESARIVAEIVHSGARILFVGLGCPKQEIWMAEQRGKIPAVMIGVGAAFDFHAGIKRQSPPILQKLGLEWLFRLIQEPKRLWKRYLYHNPRFVYLANADLLGILNSD